MTRRSTNRLSDWRATETHMGWAPYGHVGSDIPRWQNSWLACGRSWSSDWLIAGSVNVGCLLGYAGRSAVGLDSFRPWPRLSSAPLWWTGWPAAVYDLLPRVLPHRLTNSHGLRCGRRHQPFHQKSRPTEGKNSCVERLVWSDGKQSNWNIFKVK